MTKRRTHPKARRNEAQLGKRVCVPSGRKVRFPRERQAKQAANQLRAHHKGIPELRVYRCRLALHVADGGAGAHHREGPIYPSRGVGLKPTDPKGET